VGYTQANAERFLALPNSPEVMPVVESKYTKADPFVALVVK
jgi:hypothetical protein